MGGTERGREEGRRQEEKGKKEERGRKLESVYFTPEMISKRRERGGQILITPKCRQSQSSRYALPIYLPLSEK